MTAATAVIACLVVTCNSSRCRCHPARSPPRLSSSGAPTLEPESSSDRQSDRSEATPALPNAVPPVATDHVGDGNGTRASLSSPMGEDPSWREAGMTCKGFVSSEEGRCVLWKGRKVL